MSPFEDSDQNQAVRDELRQRVTLPGWDPTRTDNDPKQVFGRFAQQWTQSGKPWGADAVRAFAAQDPRWELGGSDQDPLLRVKQAALDTWKPGTSVWQDVIGDAGGQNRVQFINAGQGGPGPSAPGPALSGGLDYGPLTSGTQHLTEGIDALVQQLMGGDSNGFLRQLLQERQS